MQIITSKFLTKEITKIRSWKERLFSFPWQPCKKLEIKIVPSEMVFYDRERDILYCHPITEQQIRDAIHYGNALNLSGNLLI